MSDDRDGIDILTKFEMDTENKDTGSVTKIDVEHAEGASPGRIQVTPEQASSPCSQR